MALDNRIIGIGGMGGGGAGGRRLKWDSASAHSHLKTSILFERLH